VLIAAGVLGSVYWGYSVLQGVYTEVEGPEIPSVKPGQRINVLFLGLDAGTSSGGKPISVRSDAAPSRTDTMILASIDPDTKKVGILWIPRDTRVKIPGRDGYEKVAHAHAYGGPKLAMTTVAEALGVDVHYYVRTDFEGFVQIVDILGGVEMYIDHHMYYEDPYQDLLIDIKPGQQVLDGKKALEFVRYRSYPNADIGRVEAQQRFAAAVMSKAFRVGTILKLPSLAKEVLNWVDTNIEPTRVLSLANIARQVAESDVELATLPGKDAYIMDHGQNLSYWVMDSVEAAAVVDTLIRGIDREANSEITVEVLDGANNKAAAQAMADRLREAGFSVVNVASATGQEYEVTEVVSWGTDIEPGKMVGRVVVSRAPDTKILSKPLNDVSVDVTVIIGKDCTLK